jgi:hypothetical protein
MRGSSREAGSKVAEEKALKGRNTQEGKVRRSLSLAAAAFVPLPSQSQPLKSRPSPRKRGRRNDRRGEAPRGVPLAGRSKALKGKPHGRCRDRRIAVRPGGVEAVERVLKP